MFTTCTAGRGKRLSPYRPNNLSGSLPVPVFFQHAAGDGEQRRLSEEEIITIGQEVGLEPEHVRRALAEYRADSLVPPAPSEHPLVTRLLGPGYARARRVMRGNASDIHRDFERHLRIDERMRPVRLRSTESVWEPDNQLDQQTDARVRFRRPRLRAVAAEIGQHRYRTGLGPRKPW